MKYSENDLRNIIALCEQEEDSGPVAEHLLERCKKALAYRDVFVRITQRDKDFLRTLYDKDMDEDAKKTLEKIGIGS